MDKSTTSPLGLHGAKVLVTAGASGIGLAIAQKFRDIGADVMVTDIDSEAVAATREQGFTAEVVDSSCETAVADLFRWLPQRLGTLDVLVNNAGIAGPTGPIDTLDAQAWRETFDVNVHSQFYAIKHALQYLRASHQPSIINLSSAAGRLGMAGRSPYSSSKWAVVGLTKTLAIELGPEGVRVNAICPGAVDGPRIQSVIEDKAAMLQVQPAEVDRLYREQSSLQKLIAPEDVADTAVYLASDLASSIHGQAIAVDGNTEKLY